ncbi:MAG: hypothetical protein FWD68_12615 [Alphaproteobacteria bacterium]|nr:hypothetical protein [Alphaproteobacteria bacterium]
MATNRGHFPGIIQAPRAAAPPEVWDDHIAMLKSLAEEGWDMEQDISDAQAGRAWAEKFRDGLNRSAQSVPKDDTG